MLRLGLLNSSWMLLVLLTKDAGVASGSVRSLLCYIGSFNCYTALDYYASDQFGG
jgi:hypothetical protein